MKVIDFHVHVPDIFSIYKLSLEEVRRQLLEEMRSAGIEKVVLLSLELNPKLVLERTSLIEVYNSLETTINYALYNLPPTLMRIIEAFESSLVEHCNALKTIYTPSERVIKISCESILPVGSVDLSLGRGAIDRVYDLVKMGIIGIKIIPTLQMMSSREVKVLDEISHVLEEEEKALIIHTGCDPGLWELPSYCKYGNPLRFEDIIKKHKNIPIILCHLGSYSALKPGIFFEEAMYLARRYDNVYLDTSAVDTNLILEAYRMVGASKLIYGSDYPVAGNSMSRSLRRLQNLKIPEEDLEKILYSNGEEILKIIK